MRTGRARIILVALVVVGISLPVLADSDCWCAQYVDLREDIPTRSGSFLLRVVANVALIGLTYWGVDYAGLPNADWYKVGALVTGGANIASAMTDLMRPTERTIARDEDRIAESVLSEDLCKDTLTGYASRVRTHRFLKGAIDVGSGVAQIALLSPYGTYATGDFLDYVYLVTGGIDIIGGTIKALFSTSFERDVRDARRTCGH